MNFYTVLQLEINLGHQVLQEHLVVSFLLLGKHFRNSYLFLLLYVIYFEFLYRLKRRILSSPKKHKLAKHVDFEDKIESSE